MRLSIPKTFVAFSLAAMLLFALAGCSSEEKNAAIAAYDQAWTTAESAIQDAEAEELALDEAIDALQDSIDSTEGLPLDTGLLESAQNTIGEAQAARVAIPAMPEAVDAEKMSIEDLQAETQELNSIARQAQAIDYSEQVAALSAAKSDLDERLAELVPEPSEAFAFEQISGIFRVGPGR